jgi:hypothetical protein
VIDSTDNKHDRVYVTPKSEGKKEYKNNSKSISDDDLSPLSKEKKGVYDTIKGWVTPNKRKEPDTTPEKNMDMKRMHDEK